MQDIDQINAESQELDGGEPDMTVANGKEPVSYTHLTLPTIYSV